MAQIKIYGATPNVGQGTVSFDVEALTDAGRALQGYRTIVTLAHADVDAILSQPAGAARKAAFVAAFAAVRPDLFEPTALNAAIAKEASVTNKLTTLAPSLPITLTGI